MAIIGKTFNYKSVTAGDDGALYRMLAGKMNILAPMAGGNPFTISNNVITIAQSYLLVYGRFMRIAGGTTISLGTIPTSHVKGRVILRLDMSKLATETTLRQIETEVETIASGGSFRALVTNQDINSISGQNHSKYEAVLCTFTCSSGTASAPVSALPTALSYPLSIANGGTGGGSRLTAQRNLMLSETNNTTLIEGTSSQIGAMGLSVCYYNKAQYTGSHPEALPTNWGVLVSFCNTYNDEWHQLWLAQGGGNMYRRSGNSASTPSAVTWVRETPPDIVKVTYTNEALTGLQSKQMAVDSLTKLRGSNFGVVTHGNRYITLEPGLYRIHTNFRANPGANGFIKTCLKIGNTSTLFVITDQFYAGAGCGTNASIIGVNATEVIKVTANTNIYFLVMSQNNTDGCEGSLTIERLS